MVKNKIIKRLTVSALRGENVQSVIIQLTKGVHVKDLIRIALFAIIIISLCVQEVKQFSILSNV